jgi:sugar phosphate isomerase/epimerase
MTSATSSKVYLNGATIMSTSTVDLIAISRTAGFDGVEVRSERLLDSVDEVRGAAALVRPGEIWSLNGLQLRTGVGGRVDRQALARELAPRLEICRTLGAAYLLVVPPRTPGSERELPADVELAVAAMQDGLALVQEQARDIGVRVAFEFLGFADCPINTPTLAKAVVDGVPGVDLVLDSCHWHAAGAGSPVDVPIDRLAMVHLNDVSAIPPRAIEDVDRVLPGRGVIRLADLLAELGERGYRGPFSLETFNPELWDDDPREVARVGLGAVRRLLGGAAS